MIAKAFSMLFGFKRELELISSLQMSCIKRTNTFSHIFIQRKSKHFWMDYALTHTSDIFLEINIDILAFNP